MALARLEPSRPDELAAQVREYRSVLGWSQQDLADRAGCSRPTIARLEAGRVILSVTMNKVIDALNQGIADAVQADKRAAAAKQQAPKQHASAPAPVSGTASPNVKTDAAPTQLDANAAPADADDHASSYAMYGPVFSEGNANKQRGVS